MTLDTNQLIDFVDLWNSLPAVHLESKRIWCKSNDPKFHVIVLSGKPAQFFEISRIDNHAFAVPVSRIPDAVKWSIDDVTVMDLRTDVIESKRMLDDTYRKLFNFKRFFES